MKPDYEKMAEAIIRTTAEHILSSVGAHTCKKNLADKLRAAFEPEPEPAKEVPHAADR